MVGLFGSLFNGVSGINGQSSFIGVISNNIANINTVGFKGSEITFSSLVTGNDGAGVTSGTRNQIDQQGLIQNTGIATDIAISGQGFFVVTDTTGQFFYTRNGSFRVDAVGNLVNPSGDKLQAWKLDNNGKLPGEPGNTDTTSSQLLESTSTVNINTLSGSANATTDMTLAINLDAGQSILAGTSDTITFLTGSGNVGIGSDDIIIPNGNFTSGDTLTITPGLTPAFTFTYAGFESANIASNFFGATDATTVFTANANLAEGDTFTITAGSTTTTFKFQANSPSPALGTFNNLTTLSQAIDFVSGLTSRVNGTTLYIASTNATEAVTFANGVTTGSGIVGEMSLANIAAGTDRFNSLDTLKTLLDNSSGISGTIASSANNAVMTINVDDPLDTLTFSSTPANDITTEFGLSTTALTPVYDALASSGNNMASGTIAAAFTRNIRVFDALGNGHDLRLSYAKIANNKWAVEIYAANQKEVVTSNPNGLLAFGNITFNGDGTLQVVDAGLTSFNVVWANDANASTIAVDYGTQGPPGTGTSDKMSQFAGAFTVKEASQNGAPSGQLSSIEITKDGFVVANFTNGLSRQAFRMPLASFPNANGLRQVVGNKFAQSDASGEFTLNKVGDAGVGEIATAALEQANVELADELTRSIVAQRAFQANTQVISTADELLDELNRI